MHPVYYCDDCDQPIIGTVFTSGEIELCHDCYCDNAGDPYNPPKFESKPTPQAYKAFAPADMVNSPAHYNQAGIECIDAMQAMVEGADVQPHASYCWQNSFKYLWRWPYKNGVEDLKKARWYLDRLISEIEATK